MTLSPAVGCLAVCPRLFGGPPERMFGLRRDTPDKRLSRFPAVAFSARVSPAVPHCVRLIANKYA